MPGFTQSANLTQISLWVSIWKRAIGDYSIVWYTIVITIVDPLELQSSAELRTRLNGVKGKLNEFQALSGSFGKLQLVKFDLILVWIAFCDRKLIRKARPESSSLS